MYRLERVNAAVGDVLAYIISSGFAHHSPWHISVRTETFLVEKVAPASDSLSDKETRRSDIKYRQQTQFFLFGDDPADKYCSEYSAVNCESAVTEIEELRYRCRIAENHIIKSCTDYRTEKSADDRISCPVGINACALHLPESVYHRKDYSHSDEKSVPVDLEIRSRDSEHHPVNIDTRSEDIVTIAKIREIHSVRMIVQLFQNRVILF